MSTHLKETGAGLEIATQPGQKVGFFGAVPVAQRSGIAQAALTTSHATGTLTFTGQPTAADTFTIGAVTYTAKAALTGAANEFLISTTEALSIANLSAAISGAAGLGTLYGVGTVANPAVTVTSTTGTTIVLAAASTGTPGNAVATTETSSTASFGATTLTGATDPSAGAVAALVVELRAALVALGPIKGSA